MDSSTFSSSHGSPSGLRVLVVDDDPTRLKILENMLNKCNYQVTTCNSMREAFDLLHERKDRFDIVIRDANLPDVDGSNLLESLKTDLPVIMMSDDGEMAKGVRDSACEYLVKPIRMKDLRNIWQHVFRMRVRESQPSLDENEMMRNEDTLLNGKKRKDVDGDDVSSRVKKARVVWTVDLHHKFVQAIDQIGIDKVGPKKILDLMGVPWLTRENVASHLQKYRLYLSRLQRENEVKPGSGMMKHSDISIDRNSVASEQSIVSNENYGFRRHVIHEKIVEEFSHSLGIMDSQAQYCWNAAGPAIQMKPHFQTEHHQFDHIPLPMRRGYGVGEVANVAMHSVQPQSRLTNCHAFEPNPCSMWSTKNYSLEEYMYDNLESSTKNLIVGSGSALGWRDEEVSSYSCLGGFITPNDHLVNLESLGFSNLDGDYQSHPYFATNHGLYIA